VPHFWNGIIVPGDIRHGTRWATKKEVDVASKALSSLEQERLRVVLVPAPYRSFDGHCIRVAESRNPKWYRKFGKRYWRGKRLFYFKRSRVENALRRVCEVKIVRRNAYEVEILSFLKERKEI